IPKPDGEKLMLDRLGVRIRELTRRERRELGLRRSGGLLVQQVQPGSQAFKKRVEPGDVVTKIGGRPVGTLDHVGHLLEAYDRGDIIRVGFIRIGRHVSIHVELTLKAR
ncbi:MAG: PDZ domain-containing protein, partial [Planctomycetota bacterium]|nr:PDZ domain-containing protein [Planctomycetota bacterium]